MLNMKAYFVMSLLAVGLLTLTGCVQELTGPATGQSDKGYINAWKTSQRNIVRATESPMVTAQSGFSGEIAANSSHSGNLSGSEWNDWDEYIIRNVAAGTRVSISLQGPSDSDFDLLVWSEDVDNWVDGCTPESNWVPGCSYSSSEFVEYTPNSSTNIWIYPAAWQGSGQYSLRVTAQTQAQILIERAIYTAGDIIGKIQDAVYAKAASNVRVNVNDLSSAIEDAAGAIWTSGGAICFIAVVNIVPGDEPIVCTAVGIAGTISDIASVVNAGLDASGYQIDIFVDVYVARFPYNLLSSTPLGPPMILVSPVGFAIRQPNAKPTTGELGIQTNPMGASIYVNDVFYGTSPLSLELPAGTYQIRAVYSGFNDAFASAYVTAGASQQVVLELSVINQPPITTPQHASAEVWYDHLSPQTVVASSELFVNVTVRNTGNTRQTFVVGVSIGDQAGGDWHDTDVYSDGSFNTNLCQISGYEFDDWVCIDLGPGESGNVFRTFAIAKFMTNVQNWSDVWVSVRDMNLNVLDEEVVTNKFTVIVN
ncbi:PEGA domain-containing protein [archaeon]|nr:PEGA domain-containing protein [archaeon]